ncbi:hypothetical protein [Altererythrobacter sp. MTPC7]|uniref:hypothetical protein n=1 Tax=Altererythrobacter sp. MTPC7 TaxID=3056567 RepID=UPI0036F1C01C
MRGLLGLAIAAIFLAIAAHPDLLILLEPSRTDELPLTMRILLGLSGAGLGWAGLYHLRLRADRRKAYAGGRIVGSEARLAARIGEDDDTATLIVEAGAINWLISTNLKHLPRERLEAGERIAVVGYLDSQDRMVALDHGEHQLMPLSRGKPMKPDEIAHLRIADERRVAPSRNQKV